MAFQNLDDCVFDFDGQGEGGFYRLPIRNPQGLLNLPIMVNRGDKFLVVATLMDVVHGKMKDGAGGEGTLVVACFRFKPSGKNRFKSATVTWTFTSEDPAVQVVPERIAPEDTWSLNPVTEKLERNWGINGNVGPGVGPVTATVGGQYGSTTGKEIEYHTTIDGTILALERDDGVPDSVRWSLSENEANLNGICRIAVVGVLLRRTVVKGKTPRPGPAPIFLGAVNIHADKHVHRSGSAWTEKVFKDTYKDDATRFQPGEDKISGQFVIDKNNLSEISLTNDIMHMSLHESFEELQTRKREKEKIKQQEADKKNQGEKEKIKLEEEQKKRQEEEQQKKKQEEDEKKKKQDDERSIMPPSMPTHTTAVTSNQSGGQGNLQATALPAWVYYVVLGMLVMYFWQQLTKLWSRSN